MDSVRTLKPHGGFTLIEVMIVIVVVAILAGVALPSYRSHICKVERGVAKGDLMAYSQALDAFFTTNNFSYYDKDSSSGEDPPDVFANYSPADGSAATKHFDLSVTLSNAGKGYTVTATRSTATCQSDTLTLTQSGLRTWTRDGVTQNSWDE